MAETVNGQTRSKRSGGWHDTMHQSNPQLMSAHEGPGTCRCMLAGSAKLLWYEPRWWKEERRVLVAR